MNHSILNQFKNSDLISQLVQEISTWDKPVKLMEVCGTHTMAIGKWGIRKLLPPSISLISGPGCPVCVTPSSMIDTLVNFKHNVAIATFGDLIRVPGKKYSLEQARANGSDIRIVYSPFDALKFTKEKETMFIGIGFETTSPGVAYTLAYAQKNNIKNFSVFPAFKIIPPAFDALLSAKDVQIDGFILPGHVSTIIGANAYEFLPDKYGIGGVITGFEPLDILLGIKMLLDQIKNNKPAIGIEYKRCVKKEGNQEALSLLNEVFCIEDSVWRGLGLIKESGLGISKKYSDFDAKIKYDISIPVEPEDKTGCRCGDVLKGKIIPPQCPLFKKVCKPENPIGPCMVSFEGSCAAYYRYET